MAIGLTAAAAVLFVASLSAQGKPNFAGKWTLQQDPNAAAAGGGGGGRGRGMGGFGLCGASCDITQDATTLTVKQTTQAGEVTSTYKLDGSESTNTRTFGENSIESKSKVTFDGQKMNVVSTTNFNGTARETTYSVTLEGGNMVIETKAPGRQGGEPTVTKQTYKKG
jgi:hypothetical protein